MKYPNDDRLINLCQRHNKKAIDLLVVRYNGFIRAWAREYLSKDSHIDYEELCLAAESSFLLAIKSYDYTKGNLYKYIYRIVHNCFVQYSMKQNKENKKVDYYYEDDTVPFVGYLVREETETYKYDNYSMFLKEHNNLEYLDAEMIQILELKRLGKSYKEIAEVLQVNCKRVDFLYQKSVKKIREYETNKRKS